MVENHLLKTVTQFTDLLTVLPSASDLHTCPRVFRVRVVNPLYKATPDTPSNAATALISEIKQSLHQRYISCIMPLFWTCPTND